MKKLMAIFISILMLTGLSFGQGIINGAGATFPFPVYSAWAYDYHKTTDIKINYQSIGSGGGVKQITSRVVEFGATDAPVKPEKLVKDNLLQFPAIIGGVVPIVNLPGIKPGELKLSGEVLVKIFMGEIKNWDDPAILKDNQGLKLPSTKITTIHRADGSGTTAILTTYFVSVMPEFKEKVGVGKAVNWPDGIGAKGNEGVANYVKRVKNSIGYVEYAYAKQNKLADVQIRNREGNFVKPGAESFKAAAAYAEWDPDNHFYLWMVNSPGKDSWPITGASFILLAKERPEDNKKVIKFYDCCFNNGDQTAARLTYIPLPESLKDKIRAYWQKNIR